MKYSRLCLTMLLVTLLTSLPTTLAGQAAKIELDVMCGYDDSSATGKLFNLYKEEYQKLNPDVKINKINIRSSVKDQLFTLIVAGQGPDVLLFPQEYLLEYLDQGIVQDLPPALVRQAEAGFIPAAMQLAKFQGILYGWPAENQPQALLYNRMLMAQTGLQDKPPQTWDELRNMAKKMVRYDQQNNLIQMGFAMNSGVEPYLSFVLAHSLAIGYNPVANDLHSVSFNNPKSVQALDLLRRLVVEDRVAKTGWPMHAAYQKNTVGLYWAHGPWEARDFRNATVDYQENFRSTIPPLGSTGKPVTTIYGYIWSVASYSKKQVAAFNFLLWLCNDVTPEKTTRNGNMMEALGSMPNTMLDAYHQPSMREPFMQGFLEALMRDIVVTMPALPVSLDPFTNQVDNALKGSISAQMAMEKIDETLNVTLGDYFGKKGK